MVVNEIYKPVAVVPLDTAIRSDPYIPFFVLLYGLNIFMMESILFADIGKEVLLRLRVKHRNKEVQDDKVIKGPQS